MGVNTSRHSSYSVRHTPRQKRTIPVYGEKEDSGKWYRCWNCGWLCNIERDSLDEGEYGGTGISYGYVASSAFVLTSKPGYFTLQGIFVLNSSTMYSPDVVGGCPFCGCKNYK